MELVTPFNRKMIESTQSINNKKKSPIFKAHRSMMETKWNALSDTIDRCEQKNYIHSIRRLHEK